MKDNIIALSSISRHRDVCFDCCSLQIYHILSLKLIVSREKGDSRTGRKSLVFHVPYALSIDLFKSTAIIGESNI